MLVERIDLARKPSRLRTFLSDCHTGPECQEHPPGASAPIERSKKMSQATEPSEDRGVAEGRAQRELTSKIGVTLTPQNKPSNGKWSTWRRRLGIGGKG
jgi:hypothetical protein